MCNEVWQDEEDGTALICDDTAVLRVRPEKITQSFYAHVLEVLGRRVLAQTPGRVRPFGEMCEEYHQALEAAIEAEQRLAKERAETIAQSFVWLEEVYGAEEQAQDESREEE